MTRKPMWKRIVLRIERFGRTIEKVIPKRHGKKWEAHKKAKQQIRPYGRMLGKGHK